ncbi:MAG TPA: rRNA maturation RNase YbeY [Smithella sp.]|nr:rRNA maturation RNase YbeY [Smithella sp.]
MKLQIENRQTEIKIDRRKIRGTVLQILKILDCPDKELSICFVDDEQIKLLNNQYLGRDRATNVLSFSLREGECGDINPQILGDVIISAQTAQRDAFKGGLTVSQEIDFLIIHGILHLIGYNHENTTAKEIKRMREKEKELFHKIYGHNKTLI